MSGTKITVTFTDGKTRTLRDPAMLWAIDGRRTAYFVFDNGQVYKGQTNGVVDEDGDFCLKTDRTTIPGVLGIGLPFGRLVGWAYVNPKRVKK